MANSEFHYFYVLQCKDGSFYAGYTTNVQKRLKAHNDGKGAKYTNARKPVKLLVYFTYPSKSEALRAEATFKKLRRPQKEEFLKKEGVKLYVATEKL